MYIDKVSHKYENILIMGDFNSEPCNKILQGFCNLYDMKNVVTEPTCYKNYNQPTCIDLIFTNRIKHFQNITRLITGISDFHKMTITVLKSCYRKLPPRLIFYRDYKNYSQLTHIITTSSDEFVSKSMVVLERHAPLKQKYIRANQAPFMTKELQNAIMLRSKLRNRLNNLKTEQANMEYKRQRNLCTYLLRKAKRDYYSRLDPSKITDNNNFWKLVKPLFCDKNMTCDRITLVEQGEILQDETAVAEKLNDFFLVML